MSERQRYRITAARGALVSLAGTNVFLGAVDGRDLSAAFWLIVMVCVACGLAKDYP